jgi:hypothetical protein
MPVSHQTGHIGQCWWRESWVGKLAFLFCAVVGYGILVDDLLPLHGARDRVLIATRAGARAGQAGPSESGVRRGLGAKANLTRKDGKLCD